MKFVEEDLKEIFVKAIADGSFRKTIFSAPHKKSAMDISKITCKPLLVKGKLIYQVEYFLDKKAYHINQEQDVIIQYFMENYKKFKNINILLEECEYIIINNEKTFHVKKVLKESKEVLNLEHNNKKEYLLKEGTPIEFLIDLKIMDKDGKVLKNSYNKFKQINRYLEFIEDVIVELTRKKILNKSMKIVDFGSGKSYLTFALYYYLCYVKGLDVDIIGLDLKKDVMEHCGQLAKKYKFEKLHFIHGDIKEFREFQSVDMVFSLHACDVATDFALLKGLELGAKAILAVPCCQKEFNGKISQSGDTGLKSSLSILTDHGILKEKIASLLTDGFRASVMELCGYKTQVIEFIDTEHTPKNLLIKAIINNEIDEAYFNKKKIQCLSAVEFMGIKPQFLELAKRYFKFDF